MSKNMFRNRKMIGVLLSCIFLVITLATGVLAAFSVGTRGEKPSKSESSASDELPSEESSLPESTPEDSASGAPEAEDELPIQPMSFNRPAELRAVFLVPGSDFMTGNLSEATVKAELDKAIANAGKLTANAIVVDTVYKDKVIYQAEGVESAISGFDALAYVTAQASAKNMYVYATYNVLGGTTKIDAQAISDIAKRTGIFAEKYKLDGIYLDDFYFTAGGGSFAAYQANGSGMGYENYTRSMATAAFTAASTAIRRQSPSTQVGLYTTAVWANKSANEAGSATNATYQALVNGNADTKAWVESKLVDFIAVKANGSLKDGMIPFKTVVSWWGTLAKSAGIPLYPVHAASRVGVSGGFNEAEMALQYLEAKELPGYAGSVYDSLKALLADPGKSTTKLIQAFKSEIDKDNILTKLVISKPEKAKIQTADAIYTIIGASDPDFPLKMNGKDVQRDQKGYFNLEMTLKAGDNVFVFEHKDDKQTYTINRKVQVIKPNSVAPAGTQTVIGGSEVVISVWAYPDATVSAKINGKSISMSETKVEEDELNKDESYVKYAGKYTTPTANSNKNIGNVVVTATAAGVTESATGASITLLKTINVDTGIDVSDGDLVRVKATSAETFPANTVNDTSSSSYYPICKGAMDYVVSDKLSYRDSTGTYYYYILGSGRRVYANDLENASGEITGNKVTGMTISANSSDTTLTLKTNKQVSYTLKYTGSAITIKLHYTTGTPGNMNNLSKNPLFSSATWSGQTLTLRLRDSDAFIGYKAAYKNGDLVFTFKNSPGGLSGARVFVDVGHSADNKGATGNVWDEYDINLAIAEELESELESRGATVEMPRNSSFVTLESRVSKASSFSPDIYISIHTNSHTTSSANGTEAFSFYPFAKSFATRASDNIASAMDSYNRGGKDGLYYVTRTSEYPAILSETGFITNKNEYNKMTDSDYQSAVASGIADAMSSYLKSASAGSQTGTESVGTTDSVGVTGVTLNKTTLTLAVDATETLTTTVAPSNATDKTVTWKSSSEAIATVDKDGKVTAKKAGTATITVTTSNGSKTATCALTVTDKEIAPTGVTVTGSGAMEIGGTVTLAAQVKPENATNKNVTWSSSNTNVATVDDKGVVTGKTAGTAVITATSKANDKLSDKITITVSEKSIAVTEITLDKTSLKLEVDASETLKATVKPDNASERGVTWQSSNKTIATVSAEGKVVAVAEGSATITAKAGSKEATCAVTVTAKAVVPPPEVEPSGVTLDQATLALDAVGKSGVLTATVAPEKATDKTVKWSSSHTNVATVDQSGKVTAVGAGTTTITVTTTKGGKTATCAVTVTIPAVVDPNPPPKDPATPPKDPTTPSKDSATLKESVP